MPWSNEWKPPSAKKLADNEQLIKEVEFNKAENDARLFGIGYMKDGKHIPLENIYVGTDYGAGDNKGTICLTVKEGDKIRVVSIAEVIGDLALEYAEDGWMIYHVPTLAKFNKAVPCNPATGDSFDKQQLLNWMKKVQEEYKLIWAELRALTPENYEANGDRAKQIIRKWCLSVKVE